MPDIKDTPRPTGEPRSFDHQGPPARGANPQNKNDPDNADALLPKDRLRPTGQPGQADEAPDIGSGAGTGGG